MTITLITTDKYGIPRDTEEVDFNHMLGVVLQKGNYIEINGKELRILGIKTTIEDGGASNIAVKLSPKNVSF